MKDAITAAIAARLGEVANAAFRLKAAVEAGESHAAFSMMRMALDADNAATVFQGHVERLIPTKEVHQ